MASFTSTSLHSLPSYSPFHFFHLALKSMASSLNSFLHRNQFPIGFRFHPTDEELVDHYLKNKVLGNDFLVKFIRQIDTCKYEPWDLPGLLNDGTGFEKWCFFSALDFKNANGSRPNRTTRFGFWKSTGRDRQIMDRETNDCIGTKKTLVFHHGRGPNGNRTNWVIHEYRLHSNTTLPKSQLLIYFLDDDLSLTWLLYDVVSLVPKPLVICRLKKKADKNVAKFDEPENSTLENVVGTGNRIQESTGQAGFPDPINGFDTSTDYFDPSELLNQLPSPQQPAFPDFQFSSDPYEYFDDATSKMRWFASCLEPESDLMDIQPTNGNDVEVNNRLSRPGASESEINFADCLNSLENENDDENNYVRSSYYHKCSRSQNMHTIKELRRSPLTGKRFQYREEKKIDPRAVLHLQADSCGSIVSTRNVFSYIITTKRIQHNSSHPLVYVAKALLGIILFVVLAQEVLLYGY